MTLFNLFRNFLPKRKCEQLVQEVLEFKRQHYNEENLRKHIAYLSDVQPHRTSHAYAVSLEPHGFLPSIVLQELQEASSLRWLTQHVLNELSLSQANLRLLFNVQEYYGGCEAVPRHSDGELLEFVTKADGTLDIRRSLRPALVAVLTLVNDSEGGGTRLHLPDGTEEVVSGKPGDLLVFNNHECMHSVDALSGTPKREDGLLRMTVGWRSLNQAVHYTYHETSWPVEQAGADLLTQRWLKQEWPEQWEKIKNSQQKAAF